MDEFFRTGEEDIAWVMDNIRSLGIHLRRSRALDFGCGVGRLTQALAKHFEKVCGVDIAPSMIGLAERYNRNREKCRFYFNDRADLRVFGDASFDFVYSILTLQHMEPHYAKAYIKEFLRLLVPDGVLVFQIPSEQVPAEQQTEPVQFNGEQNLSGRIKQFIKSATPRPILDLYRRLKYREVFPRMEMYGIKREELQSFLEENRARILHIVQDDKPGPSWLSYHYFVAKD